MNQDQQLIENSEQLNKWSMFIHFSVFSAWILPIAGLIVPIILWQMKNTQSPIIDQHGKNVVNWIISMIIYFAISILLIFILIGILGIVILSVLAIICPIIGGIKANQGIVWRYPLTIRFLK